MLQDIIAVKPLPGYKLHLRFEDGVEGVVALKQIIEFTGVFEPLGEYDYFSRVRVNPELGTIQWPNEADLDPDVLYAIVTKKPITNDQLSPIEGSLESWSDIVQPKYGEITQSIQHHQFYLSGSSRIEGPVVRLEWLGGDEKAKVTVVTLMEDEEKEVIMELDRAEYLIAIQANLEQRSVIGYGNLIQENDSLVLREPRNFSMASER